MRAIWIVLGWLVLLGAVNEASPVAAGILGVVLVACWLASQIRVRHAAKAPDERAELRIHLHLKESGDDGATRP